MEDEKSSRTVERKIYGRGMYWMGDEVGRCLRDGKLESERMRLEVTLLQMEIFDEVSDEGFFWGGGCLFFSGRMLEDVLMVSFVRFCRRRR